MTRNYLVEFYCFLQRDFQTFNNLFLCTFLAVYTLNFLNPANPPSFLITAVYSITMFLTKATNFLYSIVFLLCQRKPETNTNIGV